MVSWDGTTQFADSQTEALARGKEISESNGIPGLFIYNQRGSHWQLDAYLDAHPDIKSRVRTERRKIRGEQRMQVDTATESKTDSDSPGHNIRAGGDVYIADNVIADAVVNRADIGNDENPDGV